MELAVPSFVFTPGRSFRERTASGQLTLEFSRIRSIQTYRLWMEYPSRGIDEKDAVHSTVAVFIVKRIRPEQRRLAGKPHLAGGRESVEARDRCRHSARRGGKRTRPASEAKKRLDYGRVLQKASVEGRRRGDRADGQLSLLSVIPRISRLDLAATGNCARSDRGHLPQPGALRPSPILRDQHWDSDIARIETGGGCAGDGRHTASLPGPES